MKYKQKKYISINLIFLLLMLFFGVIMVQAQEETVSSSPPVKKSFVYTPMEKIPGFENVSGDFPTYIMAVYKFGLWTVGISAMLMIVIGGYMYLTSAGNTSQTGKAKEVIADAIIGIVLALASWLLLYTINPDLVKGPASTPEVQSE